MKDLSNENVIHVKKNGMEYLQFRRLLDYSEIITHGYSLGVDKNFRSARANKEKLPEEEYNKNLGDYKDLCGCLNINFENLAKPNQNHTDNIKVLDEKVIKNFPDFNLVEYDNTDGLITNKTNIAIATTNADCILLLFFDPVKRVIANIHSGWKGTFQKIGQKAAKMMIQEYNCNAEDIIVCMCPSIRKCHFEVESDVAQDCKKIFEYTGKIDDIMEQTSEDKWNIDTILINKIILQEVGLKPENIIDSEVCSVCNSDIVHSFRVEKEGYGLATAIVQLK